MAKGFLMRKASFERISSILKREHFSYTREDVQNLLKGNQKGVRYGNAVLVRSEASGKKKRFIKIVLDGKLKTYQLFQRQVHISSALYTDAQFPSLTMAVLGYSFSSPLPYAIFETRENGMGFGFMHDTPAFYEKFTQVEMRRLVETLYSFHRCGSTVSPDTLKFTRRISSQLWVYKKEFAKLLDTLITHRAKDGSETRQRVGQFLVSYTGLNNVRARILRTLELNFAQVHSSKTTGAYSLVHADMQIDNVYKHKDGTFELLDFEWVGRCDSPVIAIMFDYGNLRARAWSSPSFQHMLDKAMREVGIAEHPHGEKMIQAALTLGILRSSLMMSRFHLDVVNTIQKDKRNEEDYHAMYARTIAALMSVLR
jgi:hypothetical protein